MPRVNPDQYMDWDDNELEIEDDEPITRAGRRVNPKAPPKQDLEWEEQRKAQVQRARRGRDQD